LEIDENTLKFTCQDYSYSNQIKEF